MNRRFCTTIIWLLILHLVASPVIGWAQASSSADVGKALDTMLNYDYKSYAAKIAATQIQQDLAAGRPIDWGKLGREYTSKPFLANVAIAGGSELAGTGIQLAMAGVCPPFGMVIGSVISSSLNAFGGAIGYETNAAMRSGAPLTPKQVLGTALKNIDMPSFVGQTTGSMIGAMVGQALIPIPVVGMIIGGMVGGFAGNMAVNALRKIPAVASWFADLQRRWEKVGESLIGSASATAVVPIADTTDTRNNVGVAPTRVVGSGDPVTGTPNPFAASQTIRVTP